MSLEELGQEPWLLAAAALAFGSALASAGTLVAVLLAVRWMVREIRALRQEEKSAHGQRQDYQALLRELKVLLNQASRWDRRAAALYPSLADLLDDKLALLSQSNGRHDL
jgi:hypothetical protein